MGCASSLEPLWIRLAHLGPGFRVGGRGRVVNWGMTQVCELEYSSATGQIFLCLALRCFCQDAPCKVANPSGTPMLYSLLNCPRAYATLYTLEAGTLSSVGRASVSKTEGHRFKSSSVRQKKPRVMRGFSIFHSARTRLKMLECHNRATTVQFRGKVSLE